MNIFDHTSYIIDNICYISKHKMWAPTSFQLHPNPSSRLPPSARSCISMSCVRSCIMLDLDSTYFKVKFLNISVFITTFWMNIYMVHTKFSSQNPLIFSGSQVWDTGCNFLSTNDEPDSYESSYCNLLESRSYDRRNINVI